VQDIALHKENNQAEVCFDDIAGCLGATVKEILTVQTKGEGKIF
jgi:hypothetical protein